MLASRRSRWSLALAAIIVALVVIDMLIGIEIAIAVLITVGGLSFFVIVFFMTGDDRGSWADRLREFVESILTLDFGGGDGGGDGGGGGGGDL